MFRNDWVCGSVFEGKDQLQFNHATVIRVANSPLQQYDNAACALHLFTYNPKGPGGVHLSNDLSSVALPLIRLKRQIFQIFHWISCKADQ
jgi:hypothetical protein